MSSTSSNCPQCGHYDQTKSIVAIAQEDEESNNLSRLFRDKPHPYGVIQIIFSVIHYIILLPLALQLLVTYPVYLLTKNKKQVGSIKSEFTVIPDKDYEYALKRYSESLYCSRCGIVFHNQSGVQRSVSRSLRGIEWTRYLYEGTPYKKIIDGE